MVLSVLSVGSSPSAIFLAWRLHASYGCHVSVAWPEFAQRKSVSIVSERFGQSPLSFTPHVVYDFSALKSITGPPVKSPYSGGGGGGGAGAGSVPGTRDSETRSSSTIDSSAYNSVASSSSMSSAEESGYDVILLSLNSPKALSTTLKNLAHVITPNHTIVLVDTPSGLSSALQLQVAAKLPNNSVHAIMTDTPLCRAPFARHPLQIVQSTTDTTTLVEPISENFGDKATHTRLQEFVGTLQSAGVDATIVATRQQFMYLQWERFLPFAAFQPLSVAFDSANLDHLVTNNGLVRPLVTGIIEELKAIGAAIGAPLDLTLQQLIENLPLSTITPSSSINNSAAPASPVHSFPLGNAPIMYYNFFHSIPLNHDLVLMLPIVFGNQFGIATPYLDSMYAFLTQLVHIDRQPTVLFARHRPRERETGSLTTPNARFHSRSGSALSDISERPGSRGPPPPLPQGYGGPGAGIGSAGSMTSLSSMGPMGVPPAGSGRRRSSMPRAPRSVNSQPSLASRSGGGPVPFSQQMDLGDFTVSALGADGRFGKVASNQKKLGKSFRQSSLQPSRSNSMTSGIYETAYPTPSMSTSSGAPPPGRHMSTGSLSSMARYYEPEPPQQMAMPIQAPMPPPMQMQTTTQQPEYEEAIDRMDMPIINPVRTGPGQSGHQGQPYRGPSHAQVPVSEPSPQAHIPVSQPPQAQVPVPQPQSQAQFPITEPHQVGPAPPAQNWQELRSHPPPLDRMPTALDPRGQANHSQPPQAHSPPRNQPPPSHSPPQPQGQDPAHSPRHQSNSPPQPRSPPQHQPQSRAQSHSPPQALQPQAQSHSPPQAAQSLQAPPSPRSHPVPQAAPQPPSSQTGYRSMDPREVQVYPTPQARPSPPSADVANGSSPLAQAPMNAAEVSPMPPRPVSKDFVPAPAATGHTLNPGSSQYSTLDPQEAQHREFRNSGLPPLDIEPPPVPSKPQEHDRPLEIQGIADRTGRSETRPEMSASTKATFAMFKDRAELRHQSPSGSHQEIRRKPVGAAAQGPQGPQGLRPPGPPGGAGSIRPQRSGQSQSGSQNGSSSHSSHSTGQSKAILGKAKSSNSFFFRRKSKKTDAPTAAAQAAIAASSR